MSLFNPSVKTIEVARSEVADTVGASAEPQMKERATRSIQAAIEYFNTRANWEFLLSESPPLTIYAPFSVTGITAVAGQASAALPVSHGLKPDDVISAPGINTGTRISATAAGSIGIYGTWATNVATGGALTVTAQRDMYDLPTDWKSVYDVKMYGSKRSLRLLRRRLWDRTVIDEFNTSTPLWYDIFHVGGRGKLRLLTPPQAQDTLMLRYYRRLTVPSSAESATGDMLDIPQDYEVFLLAWAKWHFLVDKAEGKAQQAQVWLTVAEDGIRTMIADQARIPDEDLSFIPGHSTRWFNTPDATRYLPYDYS